MQRNEIPDAVTCPNCGWPAGDAVTSAHHTSTGAVRYAHCVCGLRLVLLGETLIGTAGAPDAAMAG
ncbi:hypothetical protein NLX83_30665 [Allokutzneria sp. A3M-2-11 16]|uniref:hypothetical protein n=1 Tax=Allokutzneria sp. A3M-2-11 16 TaxID=2962043 RepID=UPI0020B8C7FD|nr:hypothetical protein [Allokutzneria sp. A3M-2-11 16]MCP3803643.1 hypothetical protein [Allokutzneria sp. A3M-2-11 16]